mgnify:CR=1
MISFVITVIDPEDSSFVVTQDEDDDYDTTDITLNTTNRSRESAISWDVDSERKHIIYQAQLVSLLELVRI